jgi:type II secretory pathway pseudopilin PulG
MNQLRKKTAGFTVTEMVVVVGILSVLASLLLPTIFKARAKAKQLQCCNNLRQIHQAITMYDIEHDRDMENYPDRITHMVKLGYVADPRVFVCPMDYTHATKEPKTGQYSLKPYYTAGTPADDKHDWAERLNVTDPEDHTGFGTQNCSYLYEFSTRACETYSDGWWDGGPTTWPEDVLVEWDGDTVYPGEPDPELLDRNNDGVVTWQEAKFWQLANADTYVTGWSSPGDFGIPNSWSWDPFNQISDGTASEQRNYPRTWLPILRCFWHVTPALIDDETNEEVLNLSVDGNTFYSSPGWEQTAWKYGRTYNPDLW